MPALCDRGNEVLSVFRISAARLLDRRLPFGGDGRETWALSPSLGKIVLTLALYTLGNLIMLRLVREFGMATAFSLSAVIQLVAVNVIALAFFGERLSMVQSGGIVLAIVAVGMITLGPAFGGR